MERTREWHSPKKTVKGRELFASWAKRLGMTCHVDEAGNLIAHMDGQDNDLPAIMMGSHLDTVPDEADTME